MVSQERKENESPQEKTEWTLCILRRRRELPRRHLAPIRGAGAIAGANGLATWRGPLGSCSLSPGPSALERTHGRLRLSIGRSTSIRCPAKASSASRQTRWPAGSSPPTSWRSVRATHSRLQWRWRSWRCQFRRSSASRLVVWTAHAVRGGASAIVQSYCLFYHYESMKHSVRMRFLASWVSASVKALAAGECASPVWR